jgi:ATP phosphoribosyltransferase
VASVCQARPSTSCNQSMQEKKNQTSSSKKWIQKNTNRLKKIHQRIEKMFTTLKDVIPARYFFYIITNFINLKT